MSKKLSKLESRRAQTLDEMTASTKRLALDFGERSADHTAAQRTQFSLHA